MDVNLNKKKAMPVSVFNPIRHRFFIFKNGKRKSFSKKIWFFDNYNGVHKILLRF